MESRKLLTWLIGAAILAVPLSASAQPARSPLEIAEEAATNAEKAATAADEAAKAARVAANALRGVPAEPAAPAVAAAANLDAGIAAREAEVFGESVDNATDDTNLEASKIPDVQILASEKEKVARVAVTFDFANQGGAPGLSTDQLTLSASTELDDGQDDAELLGLKGFGNGTSVELKYTHYSARTNLDGTRKAAVETARANCLQKPGKDAAACDPYAYATGVSMFMAEHYPGGLKGLLDTVRPGPATFTGVRIAGNQAAYKYLDRTAFAVKKDSHFGFSAGVFGGLLLNNGRTSLTGDFTYKRSYEAQDPVDLCQALAGTTQTQCLSAPDGPPDRQKQAIFSAELRHAFAVPVGTFPKLAIAPEISADVENDAWSVSLPVYFAGDGTGKLRAGLRGVYLNEKDKAKGGRSEDFTIAVFFGVPFSVLQPN